MRKNDLIATKATAENLNEDRREALAKIARFGSYTAPALLVMLSGAAYAQADSLTPT